MNEFWTKNERPPGFSESERGGLLCLSMPFETNSSHYDAYPAFNLAMLG